jgi:cytidylate kinase
VIVTVSREYGAAGLSVADGVAHALGYELLADDVQKTVAARLGTSVDEVTTRATAAAPLGERMLADLDMGTAENYSPVPPPLPTDFDDSVRREIERTVRERAAGGDVVILGRGASAILAGTPGLVRIFLHGAKAWRAERLSEAFGISIEQANRDIDRVDAARRKFARDRYRYAWGDPHQYDATFDVSRLGIEAVVAAIVGVARGVEHRT